MSVGRRWRREVAGSYELRGTAVTVEYRHFDRFWHVFSDGEAAGWRSDTLAEAQAWAEQRWPETPALALPQRVAHAVHALIEAEREHKMPVKASEVVIYDALSLSGRATGAALAHGRRLGLCVKAGRYWVATNAAHEMRVALEDRYLNDTKMEGDA